MRYRALDGNGDMTFGASQANFHANTPEGVAQAVVTRLALLLEEWFLDSTEGTPWRTEILGPRTRPTYDAAIRARILGTQGVTAITAYASQLAGRDLGVQATIDTIYGPAPVSTVL